MSTRNSLAFSFLDRYASLLVSIGSSMVIARLLTPTEIGVFSVVMVLLMFVATVRDMGAGQYLVQERDLTTDRIRAVWAVQLGLGLGLACLVLIASYPVSVFYKEPRMLGIMLVIALNYAINPFGSLTYAWLMREMRFASVALMRFTSSVCGAVVSIGFAWHGYGPISLAFGSLASTIANAAVSLIFRPASFPWIPGIREARRVLAFGSKLTAGSIMTIVAESAPELLLGKLQGLTAAGLFSRSSGLVQMVHRLFVDAVGAVCLPWFAKESRESGSFTQSFVKATSYVTALGWSFCVGVIFLAHPLIRVLYGSQWDASVNLARLLAVAMAFAIAAALCQTALLSAGAVSTIARVTFISALQVLVFVALGAMWNLEALGFAMIVSAAVTAFLWLRAATRMLEIPLVEFLVTMRRSALVAVSAGLGPIAVFLAYGARPATVLTPLAVGFVLGIAGFLIGVLAFRHPLLDELARFWSKLSGSRL
jgi:O-antigen/teichoic acid export membrane protein